MYIYGLIDPRTQEIRYIGFTNKNIKDRLKSHLTKSSLKTNTHKNNWIKSLLKKNLKPEIFQLQETNEKEWQFDEQWNIQYFLSIGCNLTNGTAGGEGRLGSYPTKETREKMSLLKIGTKRNHEDRMKISISRMGKSLDEKTKIKISLTLAGKKHSKDRIEKNRISHTGKTKNKMTKIKTSLSLMNIDQEQFSEIINLNDSGISQREISRKYKIGRNTVKKIINKEYELCQI